MKTLLSILFMFLAGFAFSQQAAKNVDAVTFKKLVDEHTSAIIDLRTNDEINKKGMIKGARQIDYFAKDAEAQIKKLDRDSTYLIYCAGGGRSGECAALMEGLGFKHVINLEKGFGEWKVKGFETVSR